MQVDLKILTKTLMHRLRSAIPSLVHPEQIGFVAGRSPHHHVRFLHDLQPLVTTDGSDGIAVFLDFAKAYDRVNWVYMLEVLERMGFGPRFRTWVQTLYHDSQALLDVNNKLHSPVRPSRGVKQGDPLSVYLFLLCIEPLENLLRVQPDLGIHVSQGQRTTGMFFADDSTLLTCSPDSNSASWTFTAQDLGRC
ncbi:Pol Polyprotein [Globisporangium polare]